MSQRGMEGAGKPPWRRRWTGYARRLVAAEVSTITRCCDRVLQWRPLAHDDGRLLGKIDGPRKEVVTAEFPLLSDDLVDVVLLNGALNHELDAEAVSRRAASTPSSACASPRAPA